jgi:hypothetical protein
LKPLTVAAACESVRSVYYDTGLAMPVLIALLPKPQH